MAKRIKPPTPEIDLLSALGLKKAWPKGFDTKTMSFPNPADEEDNRTDASINSVLADQAQEKGAEYRDSAVQGPEAARFKMPDVQARFKGKRGKVLVRHRPAAGEAQRQEQEADRWNGNPVLAGKTTEERNAAFDARREAGIMERTWAPHGPDAVDPVAGGWTVGPENERQYAAQRMAQERDKNYWHEVDAASQPKVPDYVDPDSGLTYEFAWGHPSHIDYLGKEPRRLRAYVDGYEVGYHDIGQNPEHPSVPRDYAFYNRMTNDPGHDHEAIDAHVRKWLAANPLARSEPDYTRWLAQQPLSKSVDPKHLKAVARYSDQLGGRLHVDDSQEHEAHPEHHQAEVNLFRSKVLDSPETVKKARLASVETGRGAITGKACYDVQDDQGQPNRYMVKAYHEKIVPKMRRWAQFPIQGWAEMTNQHLYHAGGIGELHQRVHVGTVPLGEQSDPTRALIIHMTKDAVPTGHMDSRFWDFGPYKNQARKMALMDFLTNNLDRHGLNLLFDQDQGNLLAIDHSRSFQYVNVSKSQPRQKLGDDYQDFLGNYLERADRDLTAVGQVIGRRPSMINISYSASPEDMQKFHRDVDAWNDGWYPAMDWWGKHREAIRTAMEERLPLIRDPKTRAHIRRNFMARWEHLNDLADNGIENFGSMEWEMHPVPLYHPDEKLKSEAA